MKKNIFPLILIAFLYTLQSCKDEYTICNLSKDVRFTSGFYQKMGANDVIAPAPSLTIIQLINGAIIYNQQPNVSTFSMPLNSLVDSAKYVFTIANNLPKDTVTIIYTSTGANLSLECGSVIYNSITKIKSTTNTIDSVVIIKAFINTDPIQNTKIYY